jgi:hypothetical protein
MDFDLFHFVPRFGLGIDTLASSSLTLPASGARKSNPKSSNRPSANDNFSKLPSDICPVRSNRRKEANVTPDRSAKVDCFHFRASRTCRTFPAKSRAISSGVQKE